MNGVSGVKGLINNKMKTIRTIKIIKTEMKEQGVKKYIKDKRNFIKSEVKEHGIKKLIKNNVNMRIAVTKKRGIKKTIVSIALMVFVQLIAMQILNM